MKYAAVTKDEDNAAYWQRDGYNAKTSGLSKSVQMLGARVPEE